MPHIISYTEEIEEHGYCQQRPELETGEKYLKEVDGKMRLRIVQAVRFDKYVWEDVAQWTIIIKEFFEEEYVLCSMPIGESEVPVFVACGGVGVLSCHKDLVRGELVVPPRIGNTLVTSVCPFGFFACQQLTKVTFMPMVLVAYEYAFAKSGIKDLVFNDEVAVLVHNTAINGCDGLPHFDMLFDTPFRGMYLIRGGKVFQELDEQFHKFPTPNRLT
ncbi:MAG: leucine-rich repeat domain-containing protein [Prevotella sp.]|nr:leucine-rich repeat domain-containing protein [Prevotella sp.]